MQTANHQQTAEALAADLYAGAKLVLLTADGSLQERLVAGYSDMAVHAAPLAAQLPAHLGHRVITLHRELTGGGGTQDAPDRTAVVGAVQLLGGDDRIRLALDIAELADDLDRAVRAAHAAVRPVD